MKRLARQYQIIGLQETHGTAGREQAYVAPPGFCAFWAHGTNCKAGIALLIEDSFLGLFHHREWAIVDEGRVAMIRLSGSLGDLDLWVRYLDSHDQDARSESLCKIAGQFTQPSAALSLMFGDFNFTTDPCDRLNKRTRGWSGDTNATNTKVLLDKVCRPFGLAEWSQPEHTCEIGTARSKIDRVYGNQHLSEQLDRQLECVALNFPYGLSVHRPVAFARRFPAGHEMLAPSL